MTDSPATPLELTSRRQFLNRNALGLGTVALATLLKSAPGVQLRIVGHTSTRGDAAELLELSLRRATSVVAQRRVRYLLAQAMSC